jgi:hypothetical protein
MISIKHVDLASFEHLGALSISVHQGPGTFFNLAVKDLRDYLTDLPSGDACSIVGGDLFLLRAKHDDLIPSVD